MVGTPKNRVVSGWAAACRMASGSNRSNRSAEAPASSVPCTPTPRPCMWNRGKGQDAGWSSAVHPHARRRASAPASRLAWVSGTPLGVPVVPEVKASRATSSGRTASRSIDGSAGPAASADSSIRSNRAWRLSTVARPGAASFAHAGRSPSASTAPGAAAASTRVNSDRVNAGLTGTTTSPARRAATWTTTRSTPVVPEMMTRSPAARPRWRSSEATEAVRRSRSPLVSHPRRASPTAGSSGRSRQRAAQAAGRVPSASRSPSVPCPDTTPTVPVRRTSTGPG